MRISFARSDSLRSCSIDAALAWLSTPDSEISGALGCTPVDRIGRIPRRGGFLEGDREFDPMRFEGIALAEKLAQVEQHPPHQIGCLRIGQHGRLEDLQRFDIMAVGETHGRLFRRRVE